MLGREAQVSCCPRGWAEASLSPTRCCWDFLGGDTPLRRSSAAPACAGPSGFRSALLSPSVASALLPGAQCFLWP